MQIKLYPLLERIVNYYHHFEKIYIRLPTGLLDFFGDMDSIVVSDVKDLRDKWTLLMLTCKTNIWIQDLMLKVNFLTRLMGCELLARVIFVKLTDFDHITELDFSRTLQYYQPAPIRQCRIRYRDISCSATSKNLERITGIQETFV